MAVYVKVVPEKDWNIIKEYLDGEAGYVLIPESVAKQLDQEKQNQLAELTESPLSYDFGGDADVWVDVVHSPTAYFFEEYLSGEFAEKEVGETEDFTMGGLLK